MVKDTKRGLLIARGLAAWLNRARWRYARVPKAEKAQPAGLNHAYRLMAYLMEDPSQARVKTIMRSHHFRYQLALNFGVEAKDGPDSYDAAVLFLYFLNQTRCTPHVKQCRWCERWFVARRPDHDNSCSDKCRQEWKRKSPKKRDAWRASRAAYMRDYRSKPINKIKARRKNEEKLRRKR